MNLAAKLPSMEATDLAVLHENAERLAQSGTDAQKVAATRLLPAIETELENRRTAKLAAAAAKRADAAAKRSTAKRASKASAKTPA